MEEHENIYEKIHELFGVSPDKLNVLQETINIALQIEYFEVSDKVKKNLNKKQVMKASGKLFDPGVDVESKKYLLSQIASIDKIEAFRVIENYMNNPDHSLRDWGTLALQESRMLIESKLLDENQIFISTGLGGKGNKLRYFVVLMGKDNTTFNTTQKKIIRSEFDTTLKKYQAEIEEIKFSGHVATLLTVVPMNVTIKHLFDEAIGECNLFGNFLIPNFIITNVKTLKFEEIMDFLKQKEVNAGQGMREVKKKK